MTSVVKCNVNITTIPQQMCHGCGVHTHNIISFYSSLISAGYLEIILLLMMYIRLVEGQAINSRFSLT